MAARRKKDIPQSPDLALIAIWEAFNKKPTDTSHEYHWTVYNQLKHFDESNGEAILDVLLHIEKDSMKQNNRLRYIREKVMDLVDRKAAVQDLKAKSGAGSKAEVASDLRIAPDTNLDLALADCEIQIAILRAYAWGKYQDGHDSDWFEFYHYVSGLYHDNMGSPQSRNKTQPFVFEGTALDLNAESFLTCRQKCLEAYIGQEFDIPTKASNWSINLLRTIKRRPIWRRLVS